MFQDSMQWSGTSNSVGAYNTRRSSRKVSTLRATARRASGGCHEMPKNGQLMPVTRLITSSKRTGASSLILMRRTSICRDGERARTAPSGCREPALSAQSTETWLSHPAALAVQVPRSATRRGSWQDSTASAPRPAIVRLAARAVSRRLLWPDLRILAPICPQSHARRPRTHPSVEARRFVPLRLRGWRGTLRNPGDLTGCGGGPLGRPPPLPYCEAF